MLLVVLLLTFKHYIQYILLILLQECSICIIIVATWVVVIGVVNHLTITIMIGGFADLLVMHLLLLLLLLMLAFTTLEQLSILFHSWYRLVVALLFGEGRSITVVTVNREYIG
jgi:hypothetical protein